MGGVVACQELGRQCHLSAGESSGPTEALCESRHDNTEIIARGLQMPLRLEAREIMVAEDGSQGRAAWFKWDEAINRKGFLGYSLGGLVGELVLLERVMS